MSERQAVDTVDPATHAANITAIICAAFSRPEARNVAIEAARDAVKLYRESATPTPGEAKP